MYIVGWFWGSYGNEDTWIYIQYALHYICICIIIIVVIIMIIVIIFIIYIYVYTVDEEILHQLVDGLSHYSPIIFSGS